MAFFRRCSVLIVLLVVGVGLSPASAQHQEGLFVEPEVRAAWFLEAPALLVGLRLGRARSHGFGFDVGLDALVGSVSKDRGPRPMYGFGDSVNALGRLTFALRYGVPYTERVRLDYGALLGVGLTDAEVCGGSDVCFTTGLFVGIGPEAAVTLLVGERLGVRLGVGYAWSAFLSELSGPALGVGVRYWL